MDKNATPSKPMITKLLKENGYWPKFEQLLKTYPLKIAAPYVDQEQALQLIDKHQRHEELLAAFHALYSKRMTGDEILDLIAFYKTKAGQKLVEHDEAIRYEMSQIALNLAVEIAVELVRELRPKDGPPPSPNLDFGSGTPDFD